MEFIIENGNLLAIDYINLKEFTINKNKRIFLKMAWGNSPLFYSTIAFKMQYYSILNQYVFLHAYSLCYSSSYFVDYRNNDEVSILEAESDKKYNSYKECQPYDERPSYYFLNPILYKSLLTTFDKIGALLYFLAGVKSTAEFNKLPHIKKFIPSNGARYPFKPVLFINIDNICPLKMGMYKYDMRSHSLILSDEAWPVTNLGKGISIIFFANITRVINRYPNAIYYKDLLFDYGHMLSTLRSCIKHYDFRNFLTTSEHIEALKDKQQNILLEIPFMKIDIDPKVFY